MTLAKIPLILCGSVCNYVAFTSPNPPPLPEEREKYERTNGKEERGAFTLLHAAALLKRLIYALNIAEAVAILAAIGQLNPALLVPLPQVLRRLPTSQALDSLMQHFTHTGASSSMPWSFIVGFATMASGALLRYAAYRHMGRQFTFHLAVRKGHKLVTDGPYSFVRHPSYLGTWLFLAGTGICQMGPGSYWAGAGIWRRSLGKMYGTTYVFVIIYLIPGAFVRCPREDAMMRKQFVQQRDEWAKVTRYRLIPYVY